LTVIWNHFEQKPHGFRLQRTP